jgi:hypothetical protein
VVISLGMRPVSRAVHIPLVNRAVSDDSLTTDGRLDHSALTMLDDLFRVSAEHASSRAATA